MAGTGCDGCDTASEPTHLCGYVAEGRGVVAELAVCVRPPAFNCSGIEQCTGVFGTSGNSGHSACEACDLCGCPSGGAGVVTKLATRVVPPASHCSSGQQRARMDTAGCDGCDAAGEPTHLCGYVAVGRGVVAKLATRVVPPAFHCSGIEHHACVGGACGNSRLAQGIRTIDSRLVCIGRHQTGR